MAVITYVILCSHAEIKLCEIIRYISDSCMGGWVNGVTGCMAFLIYTDVGKITYLSPGKDIRNGFPLWYMNTHTRDTSGSILTASD